MTHINAYNKTRGPVHKLSGLIRPGWLGLGGPQAVGRLAPPQIMMGELMEVHQLPPTPIRVGRPSRGGASQGEGLQVVGQLALLQVELPVERTTCILAFYHIG